MLLKSQGDFVLDVGGVDGGRRQNQQQAMTVVQGVLDSTRPSLTRRDVQLIQPHVRTGCLQVFGQTKGEFGIVTAVAEKSWSVRLLPSRSPSAGNLWKGHSSRCGRN